MTLIKRGMLGVALFVVAACSSAAQPARPQGSGDVVGTVGSRSFTLADVDAVALQQPAGAFGNLTLAQAVFDARQRTLEQLIGDELIALEAKARSMEPQTLVAQEITTKVISPSDADVSAWYQANQARVQGASLEQVRTPIRELLVEQRNDAARDQYLDTLRAKYSVTMSLEPPRQQVSADGRPARGPGSAAVEIIEFSDFECPFCLRAHPTVQRVLAEYGDRVRLVYRHYPLPNHPNAIPAAEASACANEQGQFWAYHDRLFAAAGRLSAADLKQHAAELGLDASQFNACVDQRKYQGDVQADMQAGERAGVSGTPAFFINGRALTGAQPFDAFKRLIDEELQRAAR